MTGLCRMLATDVVEAFKRWEHAKVTRPRAEVGDRLRDVREAVCRLSDELRRTETP